MRAVLHEVTTPLGHGAHSDWGSLTILHHDGRPGLQVHRDGQWLDVPIVPNSFPSVSTSAT